MLFSIGDLPSVENLTDRKTENVVQYSLVPPSIAQQIREPLEILDLREEQKLIFLDVDLWICAWTLPQGELQPNLNLSKFYFLPEDWVMGDEDRLCAVMSDRTFLCPRNGDVVAVQANMQGLNVENCKHGGNVKDSE